AGANMVPPLTILTAPGSDTVAGTRAPQPSLRVEVQSGPGVVPEPDPVADDTGQTAPEDMLRTASPTVTSALPPSIAEQRTTIDNELSETAYRDAFGLLKAGRYEESIMAFNEFLQLYPNSQYADNAQYWLGETHYVKREFEPAVVEYRKLIETYPASKKQSHAMLKIGYSYHELGQLAQASAVLENLRNRYSGTTAARLAEERIQRMLAENPPQ
ncbi:MAG: tol-pal system protein YbgF, partial [Gammaproteobacteria bacterium]